MISLKWWAIAASRSERGISSGVGSQAQRGALCPLEGLNGFSIVGKTISWCFPQAQADQFYPGGEQPGNLLPQGYNEVFGGRYASLEKRHVKVEVFVVKLSNHLVFYEVFEQPYIYYIACLGVRWSGYGHFQFVVVAVEVGPTTGAEDGLVFFLAPGRVVHAVGGRKVKSPCDVYPWGHCS